MLETTILIFLFLHFFNELKMKISIFLKIIIYNLIIYQINHSYFYLFLFKFIIFSEIIFLVIYISFHSIV